MSRWTLYDPAADETWIMPINPDSMSSPLPKRVLRAANRTVAHRKVVIQNAPQPLEWEFAGVIRTKAHYDNLLAWAEKSVEVDVTDHLDRTFRVAINAFEPVDRSPTPKTPWRLRYTMKTTILRRMA